jgi:hypothetical protein
LSNRRARPDADGQIATVIMFDLSELIQMQDDVGLQLAGAALGRTAGWPDAKAMFGRER